MGKKTETLAPPLQEERGFFRKVFDGVNTASKYTNPLYWVTKDPKNTGQVLDDVAGKDTDKRAKTHTQIMDFEEAYQTEMQQSGTLARGVARGALSGFTEVVTGRKNLVSNGVELDPNVAGDIIKNGGSFSGYKKLKDAAKEPTKMPDDGSLHPRKEDLQVTIESYKKFSEAVKDKNLDHKNSVDDAVKEIKSGKELEDIKFSPPKAKSLPITGKKISAAEVENSVETASNEQKALVEAAAVKENFVRNGVQQVGADLLNSHTPAAQTVANTKTSETTVGLS